MIPVGIVLFPYIVRFIPSPPPSPSEVRAEWARRLGQAPSDLGARLADELRRCIGDQPVPPSGEALLAMGCDAAPRRALALGPDQLMKLGSYSINDDGWRWQITDSAGHRRLLVLPDPLLAQAGPTFEVRARETVRNDPPPPPRPRRLNGDSTLLRLAHFRECVRTRAAGLRAGGHLVRAGRVAPAPARNPGA